MSLKLFYHPLASFCWKVQIALREHGTPFTGVIVDLGDATSRAEFFALWPMGKMPVLRDDRRDRTVPETSIIIEYLDEHYAGAQPLLPRHAEQRLEARLWDRFFDHYVQVPMQKIVGDRLRAADEKDPRGVAEANATLQTAYDVLERQLARHAWAASDDFTLADCAGAPALFYAATLVPFAERHERLAGYFSRLTERPSVARVLEEARPYFHFYPFRDAIPSRFLSAA